MPRKEARWWWGWTWTRTYSPQQQALALLSVSMDNVMSFSIDVGVMINDLITSGEKGVEYSSKSSTIVMYTSSTCHEERTYLGLCAAICCGWHLACCCDITMMQKIPLVVQGRIWRGLDLRGGGGGLGGCSTPPWSLGLISQPMYKAVCTHV